MSKGKDEAFEKAYASVVENGWTNVKHMARQVWDMACTTPPAAQVQGERDAFERFWLGSVADSADSLRKNEAGHYDDDITMAAWCGWQGRAALSAQPTAEAPAGVYAIHYLDNWDGQGDRYFAIAHKYPDGRWLFEESGKDLLQYEGDKILRVWPLSAAPTPPASEQQQAGEPVGYCDDHVLDTILHGRAFSVGVTPAQHRRGGENNALYTAPPVSEQQRAVVMPERLPVRLPQGRDLPHGYAEAWNACLTELLRLNPHLAGVNQGVTTEAGNGGEV